MTLRQRMQSLACNVFVSDLTLEFDAGGVVLGHGFHPWKARQPRSIPNPRPVHCQGRTPQRPPRWHSICQPECQFDQSYNEDCNAEDSELSENKVWSLGRANFDYCAPRAYRNVSEVLSADCALARCGAG